MTLAACYLAVALCAGVSSPPPPPALHLRRTPDDRVACAGERARGCYRPGRITTTWRWVDLVLPHEILHHLGFSHDRYGNWLGPRADVVAVCADPRSYVDCFQPRDRDASAAFGPPACQPR